MASPSSPTDFKVIGAGLPRTGTASLQAALQILYPSSTGESTIYHMFEVLKDAEKAKAWTKAFDDKHLKGKDVNFAPLVKSFVGGVDSPIGDAFVELSQEFPKAKVILTHRPAEEWWHSCTTTIFRCADVSYGVLVYWMPECWYQRVLVFKIFQMWDKKYGVRGPAMMEARIEEAKKNIPAERLLIYRVQEGWEPLCKFLDAPVPDVPFPRVNDADSVGKFIDGKVKQGAMRWLGVLSVAAAGVAVAISNYSTVINAIKRS